MVWFFLIAGFFVVELVAGLLSGSLALLSDAGHMARAQRHHVMPMQPLICEAASC